MWLMKLINEPICDLLKSRNRLYWFWYVNSFWLIIKLIKMINGLINRINHDLKLEK